MKINKRAQEEMVGFGIIIIIVAVILLVFISLSIKKNGVEIESYEVESFIQALLQKTTECKDYIGYLNMQDLIEKCASGGSCIDGQDACIAMNGSIMKVLDKHWIIENRPLEGYALNVFNEGGNILNLEKGNVTGNYKGSMQTLQDKIKISFKAYY